MGDSASIKETCILWVPGYIHTGFVGLPTVPITTGNGPNTNFCGPCTFPFRIFGSLGQYKNICAAHKSNKSNPWSNLIYLILLDTGFVGYDTQRDKPQLENGQKKPLDHDRLSSTSICLPIRKHGTLRLAMLLSA
ncbi:Uncharacterized protein HZ326_23541 [Fusarium oxysporum f. sp. albedinis]|nr:Uncharacterized protein HZ326_23541 [Fusarium oxysporum f. sp. albedinis]